MNFQQLVEHAIMKKRDSPEKVFHQVCFLLAKEFGWSYDDIINAPIPFVISMVSLIEDYYKEQKRSINKKRSK